MQSEKLGPVVDADGHILEPADTWVKYIDPRYRDRALRIERDERGYEVLLLDNKPMEILRGVLGMLGGIGSVLPVVIGKVVRPAHAGEPFAQISEGSFRNGDSERSFLHVRCLHQNCPDCTRTMLSLARSRRRMKN